MRTTIQPGIHEPGAQHPDAETLTAFAEQSLAAAERDEVMMHLAACGRCREVVFLSQEGEEEPVTVPTPGKERKRPMWSGGWRWAWVPVAAMAGVVGVAVIAHYHRTESTTEMAGNTAQTDALRQAIPAPVTTKEAAAPSGRSVAQQKRDGEIKKSESPRAVAPRRNAEEQANTLDEKKKVFAPANAPAEPVAEKDQAVAGGAGGSIHGAVKTRMNAQSVGGPIANQYQQQNAQLQAPVQLANGVVGYDAAKPAVAAKTAPAAMDETVTVQAEPQIAGAAPAAPKQMTLTPTGTQSLELSKRDLGPKKTSSTVLPSGRAALSSADSGGRTIALDANGALFLSEDSSRKWEPVKAQWTGKAVLVRALQVHASPSTVFAIEQTPRFELVTDTLQTWVSADGKMWTAKDPSAK